MRWCSASSCPPPRAERAGECDMHGHATCNTTTPTARAATIFHFSRAAPQRAGDCRDGREGKARPAHPCPGCWPVSRRNPCITATTVGSTMRLLSTHHIDHLNPKLLSPSTLPMHSHSFPCTCRLFDLVPPEHTGKPQWYVVHAWGASFHHMVQQLHHSLTLGAEVERVGAGLLGGKARALPSG